MAVLSFLPKNKKGNLIHSNIYTIKNQDFWGKCKIFFVRVH